MNDFGFEGVRWYWCWL